MSLIQEALRRKHEHPSQGDLRKLPLPNPKRCSENRPPSLRRPMMWIGGGGVVLLLWFAWSGRFWVSAPALSMREERLPDPVVLQQEPRPAEELSFLTPMADPIVSRSDESAGIQEVDAHFASGAQEAPNPSVSASPKWPQMKVMGVLTNPDADFDSVILNGRLRDPGEKVEGVAILQVRAKGALLSFAGETQFVQVGRSYPEE